MAEYQRSAQRFFFGGVSTLPPDAMPPGKLPYGRNIRSYQEGVIQPREGLGARAGGGVGSSIHTIARLNDPTPFNGGTEALRVLGAGSGLWARVPTPGAFGLIDSGYSGNPLGMLDAQPPRSPRPYKYITDSVRMRKILTDGGPFQQGIAQPNIPGNEPLVLVNALKTRYIFGGADDLGVVWSAAGVAAGTGTATITDRVNTVIGSIGYDFGSTGYAFVIPGQMSNITTGMALSIGGERTIVTDLTIAVADTTIEAIIYDSGTTGLCTIQAQGSLGTGQLDAPTWAEANRARQIETGVRYAVPRGTAGVNPLPVTDTPRRRIRQTDFPVNCVVFLGGAELVRILSVAFGPDGRQSFRCTTSGTFTAGATIQGFAAIRVYLASTHAAGEAIVDQVASKSLQWPVLPVGTEDGTLARVVGGLQTTLAVNFAQFSDGTAVLPDDEIHLAVRVNNLTTVTSIRAYFDVDESTGVDVAFLRNYFFYEWRASDIIAAIQATNAASVTPLVSTRATVITNDQLEQQVTALQNQVRSGELGFGDYLESVTALRRQAAGEGQYDDAGRSRRISNSTGATSDQAQTTELSLGNLQWLDLRVRVRDLIRVGTDTSRTLANIGAVEMLISAETVGVVGENPLALDPILFEMGDVWAAGGGGPDVGEVGDPYHYRYRYRSSATGVWSNMSPESRGGVIARRQSINLVALPSSDPQVDKIDWFRMGSTLTQYTYAGTGPNSSAPYTDDMPDGGIDGGDIAQYDYFQPWPTEDIPHTGTCDVAGTAVRRVSGDAFDTSWAAGSPVIVNGRVATLWASPFSDDLLFVNENLLSGAGVDFEVLGATKLSQPLRSLWGDYQGLWFACGDPDNPGTLYWSHSNNPECARDVDTLLVAPPSEPLQGGGIYNTFPFVFSSEQFYQILLTNTPGSRVRVVRTPCGRGCWTPWAFCIGIEGVFFLGDDGIYVTAGGSGAVSLTDPDLRSIFPKDGVPGSSINAIVPPDMTAQTELRLSYIAGFLYFDYLGTDASHHTLIFDISGKRWFYDETSVTSIMARAEEPGEGVFNQLLGGANGQLYQYDPEEMADDGTPILFDVWTSLFDGGQPRVTKQFGDVALSLNPNNSTSGITVFPVFDDATTVLTSQVIAQGGGFARDTFIIDLLTGGGQNGRNIGLRMSGTMIDADVLRPLFYLWEPTFVFKGDDIARRATDWDNLGYVGDKFIQGIVLNANTFDAEKLIRVQRDPLNTTGPQTAVDLTIRHNGEVTKAYPRESQAAPQWPPFIAQQVRIIGMDETAWQLLGMRWVWEPHPELATHWETQFTSHDLKGYMSVRDAVIAYCAQGEVRLRVIYDGGETYDYTLPETGGTDMEDYDRYYQVLAGRKGLAVQYQLRSGCPFRLFKRDCSVRVYDWGSGNTYLQAMPFGGPHRADGAAI